jgi:SanA protein
MKKFRIILFILIALPAAAILYSNYRVNKSTEAFLYYNPLMLPHNKVGVILGTSKYLHNGQINEYWQNRIDAALTLYRLQRIHYLLISGDNSRRNYDEPTEIKKELIRCGVPDSAIYLDYAGFRTFDSMIRAYEIFGQSQFTVISQKFHNQRAVFIARQYGLNVFGYNARDVNAYKGFKTNVRESIARVKLFMDLFFGKRPKFLGEKIKIK